MTSSTVPTIQFVIMAVSVILFIGIFMGISYYIRSKSSKIEAGLLGAFSYGLLGFLWQYFFVLFIGGLMARMPIFNSEPISIFQSCLLNVLISLITAGFMALALFWGIYLTNQKQLSVYRSTMVGVGFIFGKVALEQIYPYLFSFYQGMALNRGMKIPEDVRRALMNTRTADLVTGTYKTLMLVPIVLAIAMIMGELYARKQFQQSYLAGFLIYEGILLCNAILRGILPNSVSENIMWMIALTIFAFLGVLLVLNWFRTDQVEMDIRKVWNKFRKGEGE